LPARTSELRVRVINADDRTQTVKKGASLEQLDPNAEVFVPRSMRAERSAEVDVVCEIMDMEEGEGERERGDKDGREGRK